MIPKWDLAIERDGVTIFSKTDLDNEPVVTAAMVTWTEDGKKKTYILGERMLVTVTPR
jgi:hypothetical protein